MPVSLFHIHTLWDTHTHWSWGPVSVAWALREFHVAVYGCSRGQVRQCFLGSPSSMAVRRGWWWGNAYLRTRAPTPVWQRTERARPPAVQLCVWEVRRHTHTMLKWAQITGVPHTGQRNFSMSLAQMIQPVALFCMNTNNTKGLTALQ